MVVRWWLLASLVVVSMPFVISQSDDHGCGGNCLSDSCQTCICGEKPNTIDIRPVCEQSLWSSTCCQCIVRALSKGNANAIVMAENKIKVGLFQINSYDWMICNHGRPPCDPSANLNCAMQIYKTNASTWKPYWPDAAEKCGCK